MLKTKELLYGTALSIDKGYWITHYVKGSGVGLRVPPPFLKGGFLISCSPAFAIRSKGWGFSPDDRKRAFPLSIDKGYWITHYLKGSGVGFRVPHPF